MLKIGMKTGKCDLALILVVIFFLLFISGCARRVAITHPSQPRIAKKELSRMGYTVQVGAFSNIENAARLTETLRRLDLDATYLVAAKKLYRVRFGNFSSRETARQKAESLKSEGIIDEFYIVSPDDYSVAKRQKYGEMFLREELIKTAQSFMGLPYLWGGSSPDSGFDCSGLAMAVYHLNGLDLPRSSREQYESGSPVNRDGLLKGDLVFFKTSISDKVSHVGIYSGRGHFIHAPGRGKNIRTDSLSNNYFTKRYLGGRSYM